MFYVGLRTSVLVLSGSSLLSKSTLKVDVMKYIFRDIVIR